MDLLVNALFDVPFATSVSANTRQPGAYTVMTAYSDVGWFIRLISTIRGANKIGFLTGDRTDFAEEIAGIGSQYRGWAMRTLRCPAGNSREKSQSMNGPQQFLTIVVQCIEPLRRIIVS